MNTTENNHIEPFVVGKFYLMQVRSSYGSAGKKYPCLCLRVCKKKAIFEYLSKNEFGEIHACTLDRRITDNPFKGCVEASSRDIWSTILPSNSVEDLCEKPDYWDKERPNAKSY